MGTSFFEMKSSPNAGVPKINYSEEEIEEIKKQLMIFSDGRFQKRRTSKKETSNQKMSEIPTVQDILPKKNHQDLTPILKLEGHYYAITGEVGEGGVGKVKFAIDLETKKAYVLKTEETFTPPSKLTTHSAPSTPISKRGRGAKLGRLGALGSPRQNIPTTQAFSSPQIRKKAPLDYEDLEKVVLREIEILKIWNRGLGLITREVLSNNEERIQFNILMEFIEGVPLHLLIKQKQLSFDQCRVIAIKILEELSTLHHFGFYHGDLKPEHFLVKYDTNLESQMLVQIDLDSKMAVQLIDFGSSSPFNKETKKAIEPSIGTIGYRPASELARATEKSEVYGLGVIYAELFSFLNVKAEKGLAQLKWAEAPQENDDAYPLYMLTKKMMAEDPEDRPTLTQVHEALPIALRGELPKLLTEEKQSTKEQKKHPFFEINESDALADLKPIIILIETQLEELNELTGQQIKESDMSFFIDLKKNVKNIQSQLLENPQIREDIQQILIMMVEYFKNEWTTITSKHLFSESNNAMSILNSDEKSVDYALAKGIGSILQTLDEHDEMLKNRCRYSVKESLAPINLDHLVPFTATARRKMYNF